MFELENYVDYEIGEITFSDGKYNMHINVITNHKNIEKDIEELEKMLLNLRKLINRDFVLVVTKNKVQFMS